MTFSSLPALLTFALALPPPPATWRGPVESNDPNPDDAREPDSSDDVPAEPEDSRAQAGAAFAAGERAYADGDYVEAIEQFELAQSLLPHPSTAFNLGLAQRRGDQPLKAWATFTTLRKEVSDPDVHNEVEVQLAELSVDVARLRVSVSSGQVVEIDGTPLPEGEELVRRPGPVQIEAGTARLDLNLLGGELRHVDLRSVDTPAPSHAHPRGQTAILGATAVFAAGTIGAGTAAALTRNGDASRPLGLSAIGLGGTTLALSIASLALHLHHRRNRDDDSSAR